jgi:hypothetical protein
MEFSCILGLIMIIFYVAYFTDLIKGRKNRNNHYFDDRNYRNKMSEEDEYFLIEDDYYEEDEDEYYDQMADYYEGH